MVWWFPLYVAGLIGGMFGFVTVEAKYVAAHYDCRYQYAAYGDYLLDPRGLRPPQLIYTASCFPRHGCGQTLNGDAICWETR